MNSGPLQQLLHGSKITPVSKLFENLHDLNRTNRNAANIKLHLKLQPFQSCWQCQSQGDKPLITEKVFNAAVTVPWNLYTGYQIPTVSFWRNRICLVEFNTDFYFKIRLLAAHVFYQLGELIAVGALKIFLLEYQFT
ncbi:MAG: hypothetical protein ACD_39C01874G0003 [uncultured bacterium]|nr:MAG: hypothetical protein ACD_39C01874G0003 [uncultured bacterium]